MNRKKAPFSLLLLAVVSLLLLLPARPASTKVASPGEIGGEGARRATSAPPAVNQSSGLGLFVDEAPGIARQDAEQGVASLAGVSYTPFLWAAQTSAGGSPVQLAHAPATKFSAGLAAPFIGAVPEPQQELNVCNANNLCVVNFDSLAAGTDVRNIYNSIKFSLPDYPGVAISTFVDTCGSGTGGCTQSTSMPMSMGGGNNVLDVKFPDDVSGLSFSIASLDTVGTSVAKVTAYSGQTAILTWDIPGNNSHQTVKVDFGSRRITSFRVWDVSDFRGLSYDDFSYSIIYPATPTNLRTQSVTGTQVTLLWDSASDTNGYVVQRSRSDKGPWEDLTNTTNTTYVDNNLTPGTNYYYRVVSFNLSGYRFSEPLHVATTLKAPSTVRAETRPFDPNTYNWLTLVWNGSEYVQSYEIWRSKVSGGPYTEQVANVVPFLTSSIAPGEHSASFDVKELDTTFYYVVISVREGIKSPPSAPYGFQIKQTCGYERMASRPQTQELRYYDWAMQAEVSDRDGLVMHHLYLNLRHITEMISVPYMLVFVKDKKDNFQHQVHVELTWDNPDPTHNPPGTARARLVAFDPNYKDRDSAGREILGVSATYMVDHLFPGSVSCLKITQKYLFGFNEDGGCELSSSLPCARFYPKVEYEFSGKGAEELASIFIPQRVHNRVEDKAASTVGLYRDCDSLPIIVPTGPPPLPPLIIPTCVGADPQAALVFSDFYSPLDKERSDQVVRGGRNQYVWDNVHQTNKDQIGKPFPADLGPLSVRLRQVFGGCPECYHSHWRWATEASKLADIVPLFKGRPSFGRGNLIGFDGDNYNQDMDIAVTRFHDTPDEIHPYDYKTLLNGENLWREDGGVVTKQDPVLWYVTRGINPKGSTMGFGAFANWDKGLISSNIQKGDTGGSSGTGIAAASIAEDGPTSVTFEHGYKEGPTTYTPFDPAIVGLVPDGYTLYNNSGYEIKTESEVSGNVVVTFTVPSATDQTTFNNLRILQAKANPFDPDGAVWADQTILAPDPQGPDFTAKTIRVRTTHLGLFVLAFLNGQPLNTKSADVGISAQASAAQVTAGNTLTYTVNVTNQGPDASQQVGLVAHLSPDVILVSTTPGEEMCKGEEGIVYCHLGPMAGGSTKAVSVVVRPLEKSRNRFPDAGQDIDFNVFAGPVKEKDSNPANNSASVSAKALPDPNAPPEVKITSPADKFTVNGPANLTFTAEASDSDGSISKVDFLGDGNLIGTGQMVSPGRYQITWNNIGFGTRSVIAVATDNGGRQSASDAVVFFVNGPATVSMTGPAAGSFLTPGSTVNVTATAVQPTGSITKVEFFANERSIGEGVVSGQQYSLSWQAPRGIYDLSAVATDNSGFLSFSEPIKVFVTEQASIKITEPLDYTSFPSQDLTFKAEVSNTGTAAPRRVEFYANGEVIGEGVPAGPNIYSLNWLAPPQGFYSVVALMTDAAGLQWSSPPINISVATPGLTAGDFIWIDDALPLGARATGNRDDWYWVSSNPGPISGTKSHQSVIADGIHSHSFDGASTKMAVNAGEKLYAYVFLHPGYMPDEIMLEWKDASGWDHRAFWSSQEVSKIHPQNAGEASSHRMGPLPQNSRWVRLEVPAEAVGLAGKVIDGMAFDVYGGRAAWDKAGKSSQPTPPQPTQGDTVWYDDAYPGQVNGDAMNDTWQWVTPPLAFSGAAHKTYQPPANDPDAATTYRAHWFTDATQPLQVDPGDTLFVYVYIEQFFEPDELLIGWADSNSFSYAYWGESRHLAGKIGTEGMRYMGQVPTSGQWVRLEVPASYLGLEGKALRGMYFGMNRQAKRGLVYWDKAGKSTTPPGSQIQPLHATQPVFRYNNEFGYSYFTNEFQFNGLQGGPRWYVHNNQAPGTVPFYRYKYQSSPRQYFYTTAAPNSQNGLPTSTGWFLDTEFNNDGIAFYIYPKDKPQPPGTVPLRRYGNNAGRYFYTISKEETPPAGMVFQDEAGYVAEGYPVFSPLNNPIDDPVFFVKQHYRDFLGREADLSGLNYWVGEITQCNDPAKRNAGETESACIERKRVDVSGAFFYSIEFQQTGYLVYKLYKAALNRDAGFLTLDEFQADKAKIGDQVTVNAPGWEQKLEANKVSFINEFVARDEFLTKYPETLSADEYITSLYGHASVSLSPEERQANLAEFGGATGSGDRPARARVLRRLAEGVEFDRREFNRAFVLMQYFGYLRRNPYDLPDTDLTGYNFWLTKLNDFNGNWRAAEMVKAFISALEYRGRFGQSVSAKSTGSIMAGASSATAGSVSVTFSGAGSAGTLDVKPTYPAALAPAPDGYAFYDNLCWDVSTTSSVPAPLTIKVGLEGLFNDAAEFANLRLLHLEGGKWVDRTNLPADFNSRTISAGIGALSPIAVARLTGERPPSVVITSPTAGQSYMAPASVTINANASSATASVVKVEFLQGGVVLGEDTTAPYSFTWNGVVGGTYNLTARTTDSNGATAVSPAVTISVNDPPAVYIASPAQNEVLDYPASVVVNAYANDSDGIKQVEFFQGTTSLGVDTSAPYSVNWSGAPVGTYRLTAVATDNKNATMTSPAVNVTIRNQPPVLQTVSPWTVEVGSGAFTLTVNGSNFVPGAVVTFNGQSRTTTFVSSSRVTAQILVSDVQAAGQFPVAVVNPSPSGAASNSYTFPVNVPPSVTLTSPSNGQVYTTPVRVTFTASVTDDTDGANVAYYSGTTLIGSSGAAPSYEFVWAGNAAPGQYPVKAVVTDRHGSVRSSATVTVTVNDAAIVLTDDFNDNRLDGTKWRYNNAGSVSYVLEQNQRIEMPLQPNAAGYYGVQTLGTHDLREKAVSVELVQPTSQGGWAETYFQIKRDEANYYHMSVGAGSFVCDAWTNGVRDRTVLSYDSSVGSFWRFRHDVPSNTMNFETSADSITWRTHKSVSVGFPLDSMYAVMTAGAWGTGNSTPGAAIFDNFAIKSYSANKPPAVTLTQPAHNATFGLGSTITLAATASDTEGPVQRVEFYEGPNKLGEDTTAPYTFQWSNVRYGNYFITAKAVDSAGSVATSSGAYVAVSNSPTVQALLVVADAVNLPASDGVIKARLERLGFTVTVKDAVNAAASDAANKSLVFISETVASANVSSKFRDVAVPVISAEPQIFDDMQMTGPTLNTDYGYASGQTQAIIQVPSHPLAAGCTGTVTISTLPSGAAWGRPAASAVQVASLSYDGSAKAIFAYESGATMVGMPAPARRVGLIHGNDAFNSLTENGGALFDSAVRWATTTPPFVQFPYNNTPAAIPGTVQVELYDEGGDGTAYHDLTPGNDANNNYRYPTDVDAFDGGIGYVQAGEWLKYTVNVGAAGFYRADARIAAGSAGGSFHIEFDGQDKTGAMVVPNTGGWSTYQTVSKDSIYLEAGRHVMRIVMDAGGANGFVANFDSVNFATSTGTPDLVAYWKLDEGAGSAALDSAGGNAGTLQGPTWFTGRVGPGALNFDGVDDRVSISANPTLTAVANNFTVSFWAYPRSTHEIDAEGSTWGGTSGQRYAFAPTPWPDPDAGAGISIGTNGVSVYEHANNYLPAQLVYQGQLTGWTHITLVYENKQPRLYINGALVRTGLVSQRANVRLHPQDIGGMAYGYYDGLLDDIRVYNRALNATEVSTLATSGAGSPATDYSGAQNPNGVWSYGYRASAGAPFKLYPNVLGAAANAGSWYDASIPDTWNLPTVAHSAGSSLIQLHPGPQGQQTILRWTAPAAAVVSVSGRFENMNNATTDVHVVHNSTNALFDGAINGQGSVAPFSVRKTVAAGETIDFVVGFGSNGNYNYDSTGLALNLTTEPVRNQSAFVSQSVSTPVDAGSRGPVSVTFRNTGSTTWSSAGNYNLGSQNPQDNSTWGLGRVALPAPVPPGGQVTFNFNATAPSTPGTYAFQWRMVQDLVEWFGDYSTSANVVASQPLSPIPAGDWSFDEGSGTTAADASGNGNTSLLRNGPAWAPGRNGASIAFDGIDDSVKVTTPFGLTMSNTMTIGAWLYPTGTSSAGLGLIVNKEGEYEIARFGDGTIQWAFANDAPGWNFVNTGFVAPLNQWTHIALTYDRGTVKTYANGQLVHTYSGSGAIGDVATTQNELRIGGRQCCAQFFQGRLDEVRVYSQALDAAAIKQLWQGQAPRNLSLGMTATQSSDGFGGVASRAVDGNIDGNWANNSVTHTSSSSENQPWWQVDLGAVQSITSIRLWNRTDCCADRLSNFYVLVSDVPFTSNDLTSTLNQTGVSAYLVSGQAWVPVTIGANRTGRYVRVQLAGTNYLSLAEVQVFGTPGTVAPGVIQAEDFNYGPEGVAYHDVDAGNSGNAYRQTDVDIASGFGTGYCLGWTSAGEWLDYSINVLQVGTYNLEASVAMPADTARFHVEIDGVNVTGTMAVPNTGGWNTWQTVTKPGIQLTAGRHTMRVVMETTYAGNFDYFRLVAQ